MSNGTGKHPAPTRGQARYTRRDSPVERVVGRAATPPSARAHPGGSARAGGAVRPAQQLPLPHSAPGNIPVISSPLPPARRHPEPGAIPPQTRPLPKLGGGRLVAGVENISTRADLDRGGKVANPRSSDEPAETTQPVRARRGFLPWRRPNRRVTVESHSPALWLAEHLATLAKRLLLVGKVLAALVVLAAAVLGVRLAVKHVVASPRFALREVRVGPTEHVSREEIVALSTVQPGDRLLALDTDVIAARVARHPWIVAARVQRELPATLMIEVTERRAAALAVIGGLYLLDEQGHPFKHATLDEADGQVVLTGISRAEYAGLPAASEAAFREALGLLRDYQHPDSLATARHGASPGQPGGGRPLLSEIHIDPRAGFSLFFFEGGAEVRLGRGQVADKLARLDEILAEFGPRGVSALRVVHLDGPAGDRVPIRLAAPPGEGAVGGGAAVAATASSKVDGVPAPSPAGRGQSIRPIRSIRSTASIVTKSASASVKKSTTFEMTGISGRTDSDR